MVLSVSVSARSETVEGGGARGWVGEEGLPACAGAIFMTAKQTNTFSKILFV